MVGGKNWDFPRLQWKRNNRIPYLYFKLFILTYNRKGRYYSRVNAASNQLMQTVIFIFHE